MKLARTLLLGITALTLAGCAGSLPNIPGVTVPTVAQVISATKAACAVVPAAGDVAKLIYAHSGSAVDIATAICDAVNKLGKKRGAVNAVVVRGITVRFTR